MCLSPMRGLESPEKRRVTEMAKVLNSLNKLVWKIILRIKGLKILIPLTTLNIIP